MPLQINAEDYNVLPTNTGAQNSNNIANAISQGANINFGPGTFQFATGFTLGKQCLRGQGKATVLQFTATTGAFITWNWTDFDVVPMAGAENLVITGPGLTPVFPVCTLCQLGGTGANDGSPGVAFNRVTFGGSGTAVTWGTNSWGTSFTNCNFVNNSKAIFFQMGFNNNGEGHAFTNCKITESYNSNGTWNSAGVDIEGAPSPMTFTACTFDDTGITIRGGQVKFYGCHFEAPGANHATYNYMTVYGGNVHIRDPDVYVLAGNQDLFTVSAGTLRIDNAWALYGGSGLYPNNFSSATGTGNLYVSEYYAGAVQNFWALAANSGTGKLSVNCALDLLNFKH